MIVPLAASGVLVVGPVAALSFLFIWWLLRAEARDAQEEADEQHADGPPQ